MGRLGGGYSYGSSISLGGDRDRSALDFGPARIEGALPAGCHGPLAGESVAASLEALSDPSLPPLSGWDVAHTWDTHAPSGLPTLR